MCSSFSTSAVLSQSAMEDPISAVNMYNQPVMKPAVQYVSSTDYRVNDPVINNPTCADCCQSMLDNCDSN